MGNALLSDICGNPIYVGTKLNVNSPYVDRPLIVVEKNGIYFMKELKFKNNNKSMMYLTQRAVTDMKLKVVED